MAEPAAEDEVRFGPGIVTGSIAVMIGILPDPAGLAVVPALISLTGALRTLASRNGDDARGWVGLVLALVGLFLAIIWILDLGDQVAMWEYNGVDTCDVSPFCGGF